MHTASTLVVYKTNTEINTILLLLPAARYQQPKADSACITVQNQHSARYLYSVALWNVQSLCLYHRWPLCRILATFDAFYWNFFTSVGNFLFRWGNAFSLEVTINVLKPHLNSRFWSNLSKNEKNFFLLFIDFLPHRGQRYSLLSKKLRITNFTTNIKKLYCRIIAACKISPRYVDWCKIYEGSKLCSKAPLQSTHM